ncbi:MAG: RecB-like helicase [Arcobacter butzleri]|jgi:exodeoxyribonuclease V beta subunit|nr:RecB-like helicase [Arcobacteraceae bacterium]NLO16749.1 RecB-like helicase [Aliarcobacter butzleri]
MEKYLALKASAGSGKTFALSVRYITLLLLGAMPNEILTLTFTNKAANEMKQRILNNIYTLGEDISFLEQVVKNSGFSKEEILKKKNYILELIVNENLAIYTIDKFINQILKEFGGYIGIFDSFDIANDDIDELSFYFLQSLDKKNFSNFVNLYIYDNKKVPSIIELFKFFIQKESSLSFDLKVYEQEIGFYEQKSLAIANRLKSHIYQYYEEQMGVNAKKALDFTTIKELLDKTWIIRDDLREYRDLKKFSDSEANRLFIELKSSIKEYYKVRSNNILIEYLTLFEKFKEFRKSYIIKKGYLEFSDITNFALKLVVELIDREFLYFRLDSRYNHILIDEFQDTSIEQFSILLPMIEEALSGGEQFKSFFYVGDTKQSIYRFRGGNKELFDYIINTYPQIQELNLDTNYRSKEVVVSFVNDIFSKIANYPYVEQKSIQKEGFVEVITDVRLSGDEPYLGLKEKLLELRDSGASLNKTAILVSTNEEVLNIYHYLLEQDIGVEISTHMTSKLINQTNVKALINIVKYLFFKEEIYKANFLALCGKEIESEFVFEYDLKNNSLEKTLYDISVELEIVDENIITLLENLNSFGDIFDFVYNIDKLDASIQSSVNKGISILTIFKSKGLEYESVIVVDKLKRDSNKTDAFIFEYDGVDLQKVYYKIKNKEYFDDRYKKALDKEKLLEIDDIINVLYVALTRAKNNLIVLKKEKSIFDIINLQDIKIGQIAPSQIEPQKEIEKSLEYKAEFLGLQKVELKHKSFNSDNNLQAKYFGIATHYALEHAVLFHIDEIEMIIDLAKQKYSFYLDNRDFIDISKRVRILFEDRFFQELLANNIEIKKEQYISYRGEIKIIDLLIVKDNEYIIIDYKTGKALHENYIQQIKHYKYAIEKITKSKKVKSYLFYLFENNLEIFNV